MKKDVKTVLTVSAVLGLIAGVWFLVVQPMLNPVSDGAPNQKYTGTDSPWTDEQRQAFKNIDGLSKDLPSDGTGKRAVYL